MEEFEWRLSYCYVIPFGFALIASLVSFLELDTTFLFAKFCKAPKPAKWRMGCLSVWQAQVSVFWPSAVMSFLLHSLATMSLIWSDIPDIHTARLELLHHIGTPNFLERIRLAVYGAIWALSDDSVMGAIGYDVLLSFVALAAWTFVYPVSLRGILRCTLSPSIKTHQISFLNEDGEVPRSVPVRTDPRDKHPKTRYHSPIPEVEQRLRAKEAEKRRLMRVANALEKARYPEMVSDDESELAHSTALTLALGMFGGLGVATAGALGAGGNELDE